MTEMGHNPPSRRLNRVPATGRSRQFDGGLVNDPYRREGVVAQPPGEFRSPPRRVGRGAV